MSRVLSGHWEGKASLPNFLPNLMLHHISQRLFGIFLVPGVNEKIPLMKELT